jgi:hypothetical protein
MKENKLQPAYVLLIANIIASLSSVHHGVTETLGR